MDWDLNDIILFAAVFVGTAIGAFINYVRKPSSKADPVITGVGLELGNRHQIDQMIHQLTRIADALSDKNTAGINERLEELAERFDRMNEERRQSEERPRPPRRR